MPRKDEVSKTRKILQQLQKDPMNKNCAECDSKQPTWASTNLGVFVCIRCSGVHRALGTHISKVKSATLDIWNMETVKHFRAQGGNCQVNMIYEAKLPEGKKPNAGSDAYLVERFIRDKYERRKWFSNKKRKRNRKDSLSDSDGKSSDDESESSESGFKSEKKTQKTPKKKTARKRDNVKVKSKEQKEKNLARKEKKKKKNPAHKTLPKPSPEPVVDILDVSVLSFGDEPESKKNTGFDSETFVDDLFSSKQSPEANNRKSSAASVDFNELFAGPSPAQHTPKVSTSEFAVKPSTNDILGMFKNKSAAVEARRSQDIFGAAGPRAQPMPSVRMLGPQIPSMVIRQQPINNAHFGYQPAMNQNMMYNPQNVMHNARMFSNAPRPQRSPKNLGSNMYQKRQSPVSGFSNRKPQSSAFDALMSGHVPIKSQPPSAKSSSSRYVPSKPRGPSLDIDLEGWMN